MRNENIYRPVLKPILRKRRFKKHLNRVSDQIKTGGTESSEKSPEAVKKKQLNFDGPIKIIIVEPRSEYCKTVWCAIGIGLSYVAIGAMNMTALHYSVITGDSHVVLCCLAFHFFAAEAILALHYANGWSTAMRLRHKKCAHVFLQLSGLVCAIAGTVLVTMSKKISLELHGLSGLVTLGLILLNMLIGPCVLFGKRACLLTLHLTFGIPAFIMSSICVCSALILKSFHNWAGEIVGYVLIGFVTFYTVIIVTNSFMKCVSRLN